MKKKLTTAAASKKELTNHIQLITDILSRTGLARRLGYQYGDKRKVYEALGYPEEKDLSFEYFFNKYDRQDIAKAVIDRPCDATWKGDLSIVELDKAVSDSPLNKAWTQLNKDLKIKPRLNKVDKLCELGRYSILILGLDDVKTFEDFQRPVAGKRKLLYIKQAAESEAAIERMDTDTKSPRYGMPLLYRVKTGTIQTSSSTTTTIEGSQDVLIHYSRVLHFVTGNLTSEVYGTSKLKSIINRLVDLEKILGGSAEMFWRGARPGYKAVAKEDYELGDDEKEALFKELDNYEHDLRRFITASGVDIDALEQQVEDPSHYIDVQLQAISAQTEIPKRILIGSERGELASTQDKDQWKELIKARQEEHAEPTILRPFIDLCMKYGILPQAEYNVMWEDIFSPSEAEKVSVGKSRADALKAYADSPLASSILAPRLALKYILGLNEEQVDEAEKELDLEMLEERRLEQQATEEGQESEEQSEEETEEETEETEEEEEVRGSQ